VVLIDIQWYFSIEQLSNHPRAVLLDARIYSINIEPEFWQTDPESQIKVFAYADEGLLILRFKLEAISSWIQYWEF